MYGHNIKADEILRYVLAGKAIFTIKNEKTGGRFTFKVNKAKGIMVESYFVSVFAGNNNENWRSYEYMGMIRDDKFMTTRGSNISVMDKRFVAFEWFWKNINQLPEALTVYHEGRCGRCGRKLTVPESIKAGYGPECIQFI